MSRANSTVAATRPIGVNRQLGLAFRSWGGRRPGAGRPKRPDRGASHLRRPSLASRHPVHVSLSVQSDLPSLRSPKLYRLVEACLAEAKERFGFRLVHFAVQKHHLHLIVEAKDAQALARAIKGLCVRIARRLNAALGRRGRVFSDRYFARALRTPRETWAAVRYVLLIDLRIEERIRDELGPGRAQFRRREAPRTVRARTGAQLVPSCCFANAKVNNSRRHGAQRHQGWDREWIDPCSSGLWFDGWRDLRPLPPPVKPPPVAAAHSWLLRVGWRRHGLLSTDELPGP